MRSDLTLPVVIGVAGGSGSGKTTVATEISRRVGGDRVVVLAEDRYYHDLSGVPTEERETHNFDHPSAIDAELLSEHLRSLKNGRPVDAPVYDFHHHVREATQEVIAPRAVIVVEGLFLFALPAVRTLVDIRLYVEADPDLRFIRRLQRDLHERGRSVESVIEQYLATVRPMHLEFVAPSRRCADVIIPEGGFNTVALDLIASRIEHLLSAVDSPPEAE